MSTCRTAIHVDLSFHIYSIRSHRYATKCTGQPCFTQAVKAGRIAIHVLISNVLFVLGWR